MQKAMIDLCTATAKQRYQTKEALVPKPIATPSKTACNEIARMMKNPLKATWNEGSLSHLHHAKAPASFGSSSAI